MAQRLSVTVAGASRGPGGQQEGGSLCFHLETVGAGGAACLGPAQSPWPGLSRAHQGISLTGDADNGKTTPQPQTSLFSRLPPQKGLETEWD